MNTKKHVDSYQQLLFEKQAATRKKVESECHKSATASLHTCNASQRQGIFRRLKHRQPGNAALFANVCFLHGLFEVEGSRDQ